MSEEMDAIARDRIWAQGYSAGRMAERKAQAERHLSFSGEDNGPDGVCDRCKSPWTEEHEALLRKVGWTGHGGGP